MAASKYDDRIYFDTKKFGFIHLQYSHSVDGVAHWWYSNYNKKWGHIKGKLKTPKHWVLLGRLPEGTISELKRKK